MIKVDTTETVMEMANLSSEGSVESILEGCLRYPLVSTADYTVFLVVHKNAPDAHGRTGSNYEVEFFEDKENGSDEPNATFSFAGQVENYVNARMKEIHDVKKVYFNLDNVDRSRIKWMRNKVIIDGIVINETQDVSDALMSGYVKSDKHDQLIAADGVKFQSWESIES